MLIRPALLRGPLLPIAMRYAWSVPVVAALGFVATGLEGLGISLIIPLLSSLFADGGDSLEGGPFNLLGRAAGLFAHDWRIPGVAAIVFGFVILKALITIANRMIMSWVDGQASHELRSALARRLLYADYSFLVANDPARLINIISTEAWRASDAIRTVFNVVAALAATVVFLVILFALSWKLCLVVALAAMLVRLAQSQHVRVVSRLSDAVAEANRLLARRMLAGVDGFRLIRVFAQERVEHKAFEKASDRIRRTLLALEKESVIWSPLQEVVYTALFLAIVIWTYFAGRDFTVVATFLIILYRMLPYLMQLNMAQPELAATSGSVREVEWLLGPAAEPRVLTGSRDPGPLQRGIVFRDVSFSFGSETSDAALDNVSFEIPAHRATALVGRSGAGKSTVVNLLCGLMAPRSGAITVDGVDLVEIDIGLWRRKIGVAGQDVELLDGTIAENIAYGRRDASPEAIRKAAHAADIGAFIEALDDGYAARVGPRGITLSGGQRQRIGIARALLIEPEILILDEATNAVDGLSERAILDLLSRRPEPLTTIVISHRASTIRDCDHVVMLEGGRVLASGNVGALESDIVATAGLVD